MGTKCHWINNFINNRKNQLFNNDLICKMDDAKTAIKTNNIFSKGKYYCEIKIVEHYGNFLNKNCAIIGICNEKFNINNCDIQSDLNQISMFCLDGSLFPNRQYDFYNTSCKNDIIRVLLDTDNKTFDIFINDKKQKSVDIKFDGPYSLFSQNWGPGFTIIEANFGTESFKYKIPNGYKKFNPIIKHILSKNNEYYTINEESYKNNKFIKINNLDFNHGFDDLNDLFKFLNFDNDNVKPIDKFKFMYDGKFDILIKEGD